jgi:uncharacterized protein YraI
LKFRLLLGLIAVLIGGSLMVRAQSTPRPTVTPPVSVVIEPDIYVRGGPGQSYLPVGQLVSGEIVVPVSRNEDANWVLIRYNAGYGWIRRDLAYWVQNIDALPVIDPNNLTPSAIPGRVTATPFFPTETPTGNYVNVGPQGVFVRAGPGRSYLRLGTIYAGTQISQPVGRNRDTTWIMFRYGDGFGWVASNSVEWVTDIDRLPVLTESNLTPSATYTASATRTPSVTPSATPTSAPTSTDTATPTASATFTATNTETSTPTPSATDTATLTLTLTSSPTHTATLTPTDVPSATVTPSATLTRTPHPTETATDMATLTATRTPKPTDAPTLTSTPTDRPIVTYTPSPDMTLVSMLAATLNAPTQTDAPTPTVTASATTRSSVTPTDTTTPTNTPTNTAAPTNTSIPTNTATQTATDKPTLTLTWTPTDAPTRTPQPTDMHTSAPTNTTTATVSVASSPTVVVAQVVEPTSLPPTPTPQAISPDGVGGIQPEAVIGGVLLLGILGYVALYLRGVGVASRYADGFVVDMCPVCRQGRLEVETRQERLLGIPRPRHIVRCTNCRSVLREVGDRRWRYAVDPLPYPTLYERFNGREVDEETLQSLVTKPPTSPPVVPRSPVTPPSFVDDEEQ